MARQRRGWVAGWVVAGTLVSAPVWAVPSSFTVTGQVVSPAAFTQAGLAALPQVTQTDSFRSGPGPVTDVLTGPTLWTVLQAAGGIAVDPAIKNDVLRHYIVATGADGYQAVISAGEISPRFGAKPDLVATADTLGQLPSPNGFARIVANGDVAGGRYVSNLTGIAVQSGPMEPGTGGGATSQVIVQGGVSTTVSLTLAALQALTPHTQTVTYTAGATSVTDTYSGAYLLDVLNVAGVVLDPAIKNDILRKLVMATGSDGYQVAFSLGELSPSFGNAPILVAYSDTAGQIAGGSGFARIVVPGDIAGGRYVSNLASLTVFDGTAVPEPASVAMLAAGFAACCCMRRKRSYSASGCASL